ncbi:MAG: YtxH domain-containing protein [Patescibacteria group bacterium]
MKEENRDFVNGMLLGGLLGVALGLFVAPNSGQETREILIKKLQELKGYVLVNKGTTEKAGKAKPKVVHQKSRKNRKKVVKK